MLNYENYNIKFNISLENIDINSISSIEENNKLDKLINLTLNKSIELIDKDNIKDKKVILDNIKNILLKTELIEKINEEIFKLIINLPITINDIPIILHIILDNIDLFSEYKLLYINKNNFKYIIFSLIYFLLLENNNNELLENEYINKFEIIWKLIIFDLNKFNINKFCLNLNFFKFY